MRWAATHLRIVASSTPWRLDISRNPAWPDSYSTAMDTLNCSVYLLMKNTPKVGSMSNFWGAVHFPAGLFLFHGKGRDGAGGRRREEDARALRGVRDVRLDREAGRGRIAGDQRVEDRAVLVPRRQQQLA